MYGTDEERSGSAVHVDVPGEAPTPRQFRMSPEREDLFRQAYEKTPTDVAAAKLVGVCSMAFRQWRYRRGIPRKQRPGRPTRRPTPKQRRVLDYLRTHPWSSTHVAARDLGMHPVEIHGTLQRLEVQELVDVCLVQRAKRFALAGAPLPEGGMAFSRGAPSLYHAARIPLRVREILQKEPFLPCCVIAKRIAPLATVKSVEGQVLRMAMAGELQRKIIRTVRRRMYVYALPRAYLTEGRIRRAQKAVAEMSKFGVATARALEVLRRRPWLSSTDLQETMEIGHAHAQSILRSLLERKEVRRVHVEEQVRQGRAVQFRYALPGVQVPAGLRVSERDSVNGSLVRVARIVKDVPRASAAEILGEYRRRHPGRSAKLPTMQGWLHKLVELGILTSWHRGALAHRYEANGKVQELVAVAAAGHRDAIERRADDLRELGYSVEVRFRLPGARLPGAALPAWRRPL